jgi:uncharacterized protein (DUF849 family)
MSIWNGKEEKINEMIKNNNIKECKRVYDVAVKCNAMELSKERPLCKRVVSYTIDGCNLSGPDDLLKLHMTGEVYLGIGEIRECFKMMAKRDQTFLEIEKNGSAA